MLGGPHLPGGLNGTVRDLSLLGPEPEPREGVVECVDGGLADLD
jgi:hypothetical protein